jgi:sporulation protein YlmC with PRC-barrel domain
MPPSDEDLKAVRPIQNASGEYIGGVLDLDIIVSNRQAKIIAIDEQANDGVVHLGGFGKADGLACQTLDARA